MSSTLITKEPKHETKKTVAQRCPIFKKVFLKISQNSHKSTCALFYSLMRLQDKALLKLRL